jgi:Tfp pilus assembly protein PilE
MKRYTKRMIELTIVVAGSAIIGVLAALVLPAR